MENVILQEVCKITGVNAGNIQGRRRYARVCNARHFYWWALYYIGRYSRSHISLPVGVGHGTVYHGIRRIDDFIDVKDRLIISWYEAINNEAIE